jgi:hypothetical protein
MKCPFIDIEVYPWCWSFLAEVALLTLWKSAVNIKVDTVVPGKAEGHLAIISNFATSLGNSLFSQSSIFASSIGVSSSSVSPLTTSLFSELLMECLKCLSFRSKFMDLAGSLLTNLTPV